jgi:hypothetical protein
MYLFLNVPMQGSGEKSFSERNADENSIEFWKDVARRYANNAGGIFDIYNEPHDICRNILKNGEQVSEVIDGNKVSYKAPGMQSLIDVIGAYLLK